MTQQWSADSTAKSTLHQKSKCEGLGVTHSRESGEGLGVKLRNGQTSLVGLMSFKEVGGVSITN